MAPIQRLTLPERPPFFFFSNLPPSFLLSSPHGPHLLTGEYHLVEEKM